MKEGTSRLLSGDLCVPHVSDKHLSSAVLNEFTHTAPPSPPCGGPVGERGGRRPAGEGGRRPAGEGGPGQNKHLGVVVFRDLIPYKPRQICALMGIQTRECDLECISAGLLDNCNDIPPLKMF